MKRFSTIAKRFFAATKEIFLAIIIAMIILTFIKPISVQQSSMWPTFHSGDYVFVSRQSYTLFGDIQRGDVVVFHSRLQDEKGKDKNLIKRVIALPGDTIAITDGYVYINGEKQDEPYVAEAGTTYAYTDTGNMDAMVIPEGKIFAMGDNRTNSEDSRSAKLGLIDQDELMGKVVLRLYPFDRISTF